VEIRRLQLNQLAMNRLSYTMLVLLQKERLLGLDHAQTLLNEAPVADNCLLIRDNCFNDESLNERMCFSLIDGLIILAESNFLEVILRDQGLNLQFEVDGFRLEDLGKDLMVITDGDPAKEVLT
jgi:hypothetical protein